MFMLVLPLERELQCLKIICESIASAGGESVTREDVMEAIERAKFGINDKRFRRSTISNELGKLFPWMPSLTGKNNTRQDGQQGPLGYQTLS